MLNFTLIPEPVPYRLKCYHYMPVFVFLTLPLLTREIISNEVKDKLC